VNPAARRRVQAAIVALAAYSACGPAPVDTAHVTPVAHENPHPDYPRPRSQESASDYIIPAAHTLRAPRASRSNGTPRDTPRAGPAGDDVWHQLAMCESTNTNDHGAPYFGYFQFSAPTFASLGYDGTADMHPYSVQREAAIRLQARSGWSQWPRCARRLGLL
jgi:hypothetical protein